MHARGKTLGISVYAKFGKNVDKFQQKFAKLKSKRAVKHKLSLLSLS